MKKLIIAMAVIFLVIGIAIFALSEFFTPGIPDNGTVEYHDMYSIVIPEGYTYDKEKSNPDLYSFKSESATIYLHKRHSDDEARDLVNFVRDLKTNTSNSKEDLKGLEEETKIIGFDARSVTCQALDETTLRAVAFLAGKDLYTIETRGLSEGEFKDLLNTVKPLAPDKK